MRRIAACSPSLAFVYSCSPRCASAPVKPPSVSYACGREDARLPPVEQLGQRVLQQRQSTRLVDDVGDDAGHQPRFELDAGPVPGSVIADSSSSAASGVTATVLRSTSAANSG